MLARTRGSAILILLLGIWGGIVPFVGGYFGYPSGAPTWHWSMTNAMLSVAAGAVAVFGSLLMMSGRPSMGRLGGLLALIGGARLILGTIFLPPCPNATSLSTPG